METYKHEAIQQCLDLLDSMTVTGVRNAEKVAVIARILMHPTKDEKKEAPDGSCKEE